MLKLWEFISTVGFAVSYFFYDIYVATGVLMAFLSLGVGAHWTLKQPLKPHQFWGWVVVMVFGGATLFFQDPIYIKWKPSITSGIGSCVFFASGIFMKESILERFLAPFLQDAPKQKLRLWNSVTGLYLLGVAILNRFVAESYDEATWVRFKVMGIFALNVSFFMASFLFFKPWIEKKNV
jgi:intracellular septation protein